MERETIMDAVEVLHEADPDLDHGVEAVLAVRAEVEAVLPEKIAGVVLEVDPPEEVGEEEMIVEGDERRAHPKPSPLK